jgi:hypothetical protein
MQITATISILQTIPQILVEGLFVNLDRSVKLGSCLGLLVF